MTDYYIVLDADSVGWLTEDISFKIPVLDQISQKEERQYTSISVIPARSNRQFGFEPKKSEITIDFWLNDQGEDVAIDRNDNTTFARAVTNGDTPVGQDGYDYVDPDSNGAIVTLQEQLRYLKTWIYTPELGADWYLYGGQFSDPNGDGTDEGTPIVINRFNPRFGSQNKKWIPCTLNLKLGISVG